jgi:hypothetical protein
MIRSMMLLALAASTATAQSRDSTAFTDLRADANEHADLRAIISIGCDRQTAASAFAIIADRARLNLTFDPRLRGLETKVVIPPRERTVAAALVEVARASRVVVRVSRRGQLIVVAAPNAVVSRRAPQTDTSGSRRAVALPTVRTEDVRSEYRSFANETNVGAASITGRELRASPSFVEPDVLRSIQLLPGIASRSDWTAGFNVRGGEGDQSMVMIDGFPIYTPFHLGGVFSTFIDPTVGNVELRKGALPARFGGRLSGVLDVQSAEPATEDVDGTVEVSLVSSTGSIGRRFADGDGSWMVAARRTYADAVAGLLYSSVFPYHFRDVQGHVTRQFSNGLRTSLTAYHGVDVLGGTSSNDMSGGWGNSIVGASVGRTVRGVIGDSVSLDQRASVTRFDAHIDVQSDYFHTNNSVTDARATGTIAVYRGRSTSTLGYEVQRQTMGYRGLTSSEGLGDIFPLDSLSQRLTVGSVFADHLWRRDSSLIVEAGARLDVVQPMGWSGVSPRLAIKYLLSPKLALTAGGGGYSQWVHSMGREEEPVQPLQFWVGSDSLHPVSRARDAMLGVERWMSPRRMLHVEAFYKRYDDLLIPNTYSDSRTLGDEFNRMTGTSYGVDVLLRQLDGGAFSGWLAYTYAFGSRTRLDGTRFYPSQDLRHNLNLVGSWKRGAYSFGARANIASGLPTTPALGGYLRDAYNPVTRRWIPTNDFSNGQTIPGAFNSARLPMYTRLDVSINRTGRLYGAVFTPYASIVNVLNRHNPAAYMYTFDGHRGGERASFPNLPFAPTFGVTLAY